MCPDGAESNWNDKLWSETFISHAADVSVAMKSRNPWGQIHSWKQTRKKIEGPVCIVSYGITNLATV